jgi:hypothetical protein
MKIGRSILLSLPILLIAAGLRAEVLPFNVEVGFRFLSLDGNRGMYRTQVNEQGGFVLRTFSLSTPELRIDSRDLGIGPSSALRLESLKPGMYRLRVGYRKMDAFSMLPDFASQQHTLDRTRTMFDADLELLPDRAIVPFVGYSFNRNSGPGSTTYFVGQDEFRLAQDLSEQDREFRAGASFQFASFHGQVTQGWRRFRGTEVLTLAPGAGAGNNSAPVLGQPVTASEASRYTKTSVNTPFTNLYIAGYPTQRVRLIGNYARFSASSDGSGSEDLAGTFVSFPLGRDFFTVDETSSTRAKNSTWRGGGRAEITLGHGIDFLASYQKERREISGSALVSTLYLQSIAFGGAGKEDLTTILNSSNSLDRDEQTWTAGFSARSLGPFAIRVEFRDTEQGFDVAPDLSEIVIPGSQGGTFDRRIRTLDTGASFTHKGFSVATSWRSDRANTPVFRTDYLSRNRYRARAGWSSSRFNAGVSAQETKQNNDVADGKVRETGVDFTVAPIKALQLRGSMSRYRADTEITARSPENFNIYNSVYLEKGTSREGGFAVLYKRVSVDGSYSRFENKGLIPFDIDRVQSRATLDLKGHTGLAAEWNRDKYRQGDAPLSNYSANRYGVYFRWTP